MLHQPLADELLGKLTLRLAFRETLLVAVGVEVTRAVGRMNLVDQVNLAVALAEFVLRIDEDQAPLGGHFRSPVEQGQRIAFELFVIFFRHETLRDDLLFGDVLVVRADFGFGRRRDDRTVEALVLAHAVGQGHAADRPGPRLIIAPRAAGQIATDDHLDRERLAPVADGHHRVGRGDLPVRTDVGRRIEKLRRDLVQHLPLERNTFGKHHVERRNAVGNHHRQIAVVDIVHIADLALVQAFLAVEMKVCLENRFCHFNI